MNWKTTLVTLFVIVACAWLFFCIDFAGYQRGVHDTQAQIVELIP